jgi:hypothetical protein
LSGAQLFVQSEPKVENGGEGAVASVHRRVQLLVGHLDRSGLFGGGSTVAWGGRGDRFRLHLVACARTRSARDGRWPSLPWGVGRCVSQGATGKAHRESASTGRAQRATRGRRPHEAEARPLGGTDAGGAGSTVQSAGVTGGPSEAILHGRGGPGAEAVHGARRTRLVGLPNDYRVAVQRLGCGWGGGAHRLGGGSGRMAAPQVRVPVGWRCAAQFSVAMQRRLGWRRRS